MAEHKSPRQLYPIRIASLLPDLAHNRMSWAGTVIFIIAFCNSLFLFLIGLFGKASSPYMGILTWIIFPAIAALGVLFLVVGMWREHRRRRKLGYTEAAPYPKIDFNSPATRRKFLAFTIAGLFFGVASAVGSYRAYQYTETVAFCGATCHEPMHPEYTAYLNSSHARVLCVDCHVGPGAGWYVKSKLAGAYQIYSVAFHKYPHPISTPVKNLRPAAETCEQCHWPERFIGAQMKAFIHYSYDDANTPRQLRLLIKTGGGSTSSPLAAGIHWHMNIANRISYIASDPQRQTIPWVRVEDKEGHVTEYVARGANLTPQQIAAAPKRVMDCMDCHNRPSHIYLAPDQSVDLALLGNKIDRTLPGVKSIATTALTGDYKTTEEAQQSIARSMEDAYKSKYPQAYSDRRASINQAIAETQAIFRRTIFPEMKTDWRTHPNNIGHFYFPGCFRCHDGEHVTSAGQPIRKECNICHAVLEQQEGSSNPINVAGGEFKHPVDIGDLKGADCTACHNGGPQ